MSWSSFQTRVPGKWVLAGEHAVLRGATAIALPHPSFGLSLSFENHGESRLEVYPDSAKNIIDELIHSISDAWSDQEVRPFHRPKGILKIESSIPVGAGLGSSAALCVALTRWMAEPLSIRRSEEQFEFAKRLEHRFHGRSSGMDVAVATAGEAIAFGMERGAKPIGIRRLPKFTFHDTQLRTRTSEAVMQVEKYRDEFPIASMKTDEWMASAARSAMEGLVRYDRGDLNSGLELLASSMRQSQECFYDWGLVPTEAKRVQENLLNEGALAAKLTGAGGGGFVVALWPENST